MVKARRSMLLTAHRQIWICSSLGSSGKSWKSFAIVNVDEDSLDTTNVAGFKLLYLVLELVFV